VPRAKTKVEKVKKKKKQEKFISVKPEVRTTHTLPWNGGATKKTPITPRKVVLDH
jgi:hypothetical protein